MKIVAAIYGPPELFPPTIWAVQELSATVGDVTIVTRNIAVKPWPFNAAVNVLRTGKRVQLHEPLSAYRKAAEFALFYKELRRQVNKTEKDDDVIYLAYDSLALYAFYLMKKKLKGKFLWYHSHDVAVVTGLSKLSVMWWAAKYESRGIKRAKLFTLPSRERLGYYGVDDYKGRVCIIPNYPSARFLGQLNLPLPSLQPEQPVRLIYQGSISPGHCLEEVIEAMASVRQNRPELTLIGWCNAAYRKKLQALADTLGITESLHFADAVPYDQLYAITATHHIGLAIHKPDSIIYSTGGSASNKIYEYISVGLPVILFDNQHFRDYCGRYKWAFFTDGTPASISKCIIDIAQRHTELSMSAKQDFLEGLNYERNFDDFVNKELKH